MLMGLLFVVAVGVVEGLAPSTGVGALLAPGMLLAAVAFTEGIHSDHGGLYIALAIALNVVVYAGVVTLVYRFREKKKS